MTTTNITVPADQEWTKAVLLSWFIKAGESIKEGEPLVELETEKVAFEVPAPVSGTLVEILVDSDAEVLPGTILGRMREGNAAAEVHEQQIGSAGNDKIKSSKKPIKANTDSHEHRLSPSVRRLVREHNLDPRLIEGSGKSNRLTRRDVENYLVQSSAPKGYERTASSGEDAPQISNNGNGSNWQISHSSMRRKIAENMSKSVVTAPHVTAVFEADFSNIIKHRIASKADFTSRGVKLTYTAYLIAACAQAMKVAPTVNSRWHDDYLEVFSDVNIGVGVSLESEGLIVPVVRETQSLSLFSIAENLQQITDKARAGKLNLNDVKGGTFTISNHGMTGSLVATPIIINQPQSAVLGVGKLEKRVIVREVDGQDTMQIRPMAYVSLTIDHRVLDGAQTNTWLSEFVKTIETWPMG